MCGLKLNRDIQLGKTGPSQFYTRYLGQWLSCSLYMPEVLRWLEDLRPL